jgi:hypothetical protein
VPQGSATCEECGKRGGLPDGQRHGTEHRALAASSSGLGDRGERGPIIPEVYRRSHEHTEHPGEQQAGNHPRQCVAGQVTGGVLVLNPMATAMAVARRP